MSVKRFLIGNDGAGFRIRQSLPGHDVRETDLDTRLFDADFIPGRVIGSGAFLVGGNTGGASPYSGSMPHGLGRTPDLLIATGQPVDHNGSPFSWSYIYRLSTSAAASWSTLNNPNMSGRACTPFYFDHSTDNPSSHVTSAGNGGWIYGYDATSVTATYWGTNLDTTAGVPPGDHSHDVFIRVAWTALEL